MQFPNQNISIGRFIWKPLRKRFKTRLFEYERHDL